MLAARELVAERGFGSDRVGLRRARRAFLGLPADHPAAAIVASPDFYKAPEEQIQTVLARIETIHEELERALARWVELEDISG